MTPIRDWDFNRLPFILTIIIIALLMLPRAVVIMLLPSNACMVRHPMHRLWDFVRFGPLP